MKLPPLTRSVHSLAGAVAICSTAIGFVPSSTEAAPPPGTWTTTFSDDFNGTDLDGTKWLKGHRNKDRLYWQEEQAYRPENVSVSNGTLKFIAEKRSTPCYNQNIVGWEDYGRPTNFASGAVSTCLKFTQTYGYYEASIKMGSRKGSWPAFWLLPDRLSGNGGSYYPDTAERYAIGSYSVNGGPAVMGTEMDILESMGSWKYLWGHGGAHVGHIWAYSSGNSAGGYARENNGAGPGLYQIANPDTAFHTYGMYWGPGVVTFYIDGNQVASHTDSVHTSAAPSYLLLNLAMTNNDWQNSSYSLDTEFANGATDTMEVDYVKVWSGNPSTPSTEPGISREVWTGVGGSSVSAIPLGAAPSITDTLATMEAPTNWADDYGTRLRGYITAPATGSYTFWVASDDASELWLSTNDTVGTKSRIAYVSGWTNSREWTREGNQKSAAITLTAGQRYYVEVLQKEGWGGDNLAVGWARPGEATTAPSEIVPNSVLTKYGSIVSGIQDAAIYEFEPAHATGQRMDTNGVSTGDGANVHTWADVNSANQRWKAINVGQDLWAFEPTHAPGKRLDVSGAGSASGTNVQQWTANTSGAQRWKAIPVAGGLYEFEPLCAPGMRLEVAGGGTGSGTNVQIYTSNGLNPQRWRLLKQ
ncbi:MAG: RICIN domain-containing protein [Verrucomicrobiota bacterium]